VPPNDEAIGLTLEVTGPEAQGLGSASRRQFGTGGGHIGRAEGNDWVLPHALVSGHHASIEYSGGAFYITDSSTNGVFVNSKQNRLARGQPSLIRDGDTIIIEPFHIQVSIVRQPAHAPAFHPLPDAAPRQVGEGFADPFQSVQRGDAFGAAGPAPVPAAHGDEVDPLKLLGIAGDAQPVRDVPRARDLEAQSPLADHFRPPAPVPPPPAPRPGALIPDDYDPALEIAGGEAQPPAAVAPPPQIERPYEAPPARPIAPEPARPRREHTLDLAEVLAAAGLENAPVTPQLATHLGAILKVVVGGVMDVLRSRQEIKDEFRMRATRFQPGDNNPLKFSANVSDALHNLLVKQNPAYLGPVEAFEDAFDDLRNHQLAVLAGMRVAFEAMLAEFDPERLQAQFDRRVKKKPLLGGGPEAQYWEMYRDRVQELTKDVEATFRTLFGDRFVSAYEEQLDRLNPRRGRKG
jgi:type VI secretion system FHA domain protein